MRKKVVSLDIDITTFQEFLEAVLSAAARRKPGYVCFANAHMAVEAYRDPSFLQAVNQSTFTTADGVPVQKGLKSLYGIGQDRIAGMDVMPQVIKASENQGLSIFFYGSSEEVLHKIKHKVLAQYPKLKIAGMISPPFGVYDFSLAQKHIETINGSAANIVMVALGCPKQERWMHENTSKINAVLLGLGGAFEVFSGLKGRAPKWLRNSGMEWAYRFAQDPRRLWKRYLSTNSQFMVLFAKQLVNIKILKRPY